MSATKQIQVDSERKDMGYSTMFNKNIVNPTVCTINIKIPASMSDKFSAGSTYCRSPKP